jgi:hypothetical protein
LNENVIFCTKEAYGCETWSFVLKEDYRVNKFGNGIPRRTSGTQITPKYYCDEVKTKLMARYVVIVGRLDMPKSQRKDSTREIKA